ncbi:TRIM35 [Mytilus edulis]|uniref:TRIM35 n=1 Tax=Mytilus edulis TaxID=6550 RepID=A0A8S3RQ57_MYTED|nr:TRIM35 [Mytilus edulis]
MKPFLSPNTKHYRPKPHIAQTCKLHNEKFKLFCRDHDCPCCQKYLWVEAAVQNIKQLRTNRRENLTLLENKKREIEAEIKQSRVHINHHLDKLQDDLINELVRVEQQENRKIEKLLTTLKKKESDIIEINKSLQQISAIVQKFGEINVSSDPCDFSIQKRKDRQAQIMIAFPTRNIDNLTLKLQKRINTAGLSNVHSCSLLPGDKMYSRVLANKR